MKNNLTALSIFCLAVSFVIGSWLIANSLGETKTTKIEQTQNQLFTKPELAEYLGISVEEVQKLTENPSGVNSYTSEIPHIKIENTHYYPKKAVDQWLLNVQVTVVQ